MVARYARTTIMVARYASLKARISCRAMNLSCRAMNPVVVMIMARGHPERVRVPRLQSAVRPVAEQEPVLGNPGYGQLKTKPGNQAGTRCDIDLIRALLPARGHAGFV